MLYNIPQIIHRYFKHIPMYFYAWSFFLSIFVVVTNIAKYTSLDRNSRAVSYYFFMITELKYIENQNIWRYIIKFVFLKYF